MMFPSPSGRAGAVLSAALVLFATCSVGLILAAWFEPTGDGQGVTVELDGPSFGKLDTVTFTEDVAPILFENCSSCHRPSGPAPFKLLTYEDAASRAAEIAEETERRYMPPWLPTPGEVEFAGERRLASSQIETIRAWVDAGAPRGDPAHLPPVPPFHSSWQLGEPDLVASFPTYEAPSAGRDVYRNFALPVPVDTTRYVRAVDLRPGNPEVVHHARLMVDSTPSSRKLDAADPEPGFDGMELRGEATNPSGHFVGWTPGRVPHGGYEDLAWRLQPGSDLVLQLHLRPTGRRETIRPQIGFYLTDAPSRSSVLVMLGTEVIDIPAGEARYEVRDSFTLPVPVEVVSVYPHAHYLGKTMEGLAVLPDGRTRRLIHIADWDFDWQDQYHLAEPVALPAGTVLSMRYTYDNSTANPQNPNDPPVRVTYGSSSTDEMADLILQVVPPGPAAAERLDEELARKYQRGASKYSAWKEYTLGLQAAEQGRLTVALAHYRASLRERDDPQVLSAMAEVAVEMDNPGLAILSLERAIQLARQARDEGLVEALRERLERLRGGVRR
ncbi:MAG: tetratricopeptide repeat protein [Gemmatimonadota bacterium]|nr:tetratricopeptide repeat protein [Gemmatimonadota bacterium]